MQECLINWWQSPLFIAIIPIIGGVLGWWLNILYIHSSPYKIDRDVFEEIQDIYESNNYALNLAIYASMYGDEEKNKIIQLTQLAENEKYDFQDKKLQKKWNEIKRLILKISKFIFARSTKDKGFYIVDYKNNEELKLNLNDGESLLKNYKELLKMAKNELYIERIKK